MLFGGLNSGAEGLVVASYFDETISPDASILELTPDRLITDSNCELTETQDQSEKLAGMKTVARECVWYMFLSCFCNKGIPEDCVHALNFNWFCNKENRVHAITYLLLK